MEKDQNFSIFQLQFRFTYYLTMSEVQVISNSFIEESMNVYKIGSIIQEPLVFRVRAFYGPYGSNIKMVVFDVETKEGEVLHIKSFGKSGERLTSYKDHKFLQFKKLKVIDVHNLDYHNSKYNFELLFNGYSRVEPVSLSSLQ